MKKWLLIGIAFVVVIVLITLALMGLNKDASKEPAEVVEVNDNFQTINHAAYKVSFQVPIEWKMSVYESGMGYVSGFFNGDTTAVYFELDAEANVDNLDVEDLIQKALPYVGQAINQDGLTGIAYTGQVIAEEDYETGASRGYEVDSYKTGRYFIVDDKILEASCTAIGEDYSLYINACNDALGSIRKI